MIESFGEVCAEKRDSMEKLQVYGKSIRSVTVYIRESYMYI